MPYAPVLPGGGRDASGNIFLNWFRRSRLGTTPLTGDVPLGETIEQYQIIIYTDNTYTTPAITLTSTTTSVEVTVAAQTAAFGGPLTTGNCFWSVAQLGALGYGYQARGVT